MRRRGADLIEIVLAALMLIGLPLAAAQILELAVAIRDYVYATTIACMSGQTLPSNVLTIA